MQFSCQKNQLGVFIWTRSGARGGGGLLLRGYDLGAEKSFSWAVKLSKGSAEEEGSAS
jgi:hypothetical protein